VTIVPVSAEVTVTDNSMFSRLAQGETTETRPRAVTESTIDPVVTSNLEALINSPVQSSADKMETAEYEQETLRKLKAKRLVSD